MRPLEDGDSMYTDESMDAQPLLGRIGGDDSLYHAKLLSGICPSLDDLRDQDSVRTDQEQYQAVSYLLGQGQQNASKNTPPLEKECQVDTCGLVANQKQDV